MVNLGLVFVYYVVAIWLSLSLYSERQHQSYDDCLEDKREDYQNCSVLYCAGPRQGGFGVKPQKDFLKSL